MGKRLGEKLGENRPWLICSLIHKFGGKGEGDVEQKITSADKIDEWFELKTKGLTAFAKAELKQKWGTIKKKFSSRSRLEKIVMDIMLDPEYKE